MAGFFVSMVAAVAGFAGGVSLLVAYQHDAREVRELTLAGRDAVVTRIDHHREQRTRRGMVFHTAELTFRTDEGKRVSVVRDLPQPVVDRMERGEVLKLRYLPADPERARFAEDGAPRWMWWMALAIIAASVVVAGRGYLSR